MIRQKAIRGKLKTFSLRLFFFLRVLRLCVYNIRITGLDTLVYHLHLLEPLTLDITISKTKDVSFII